LCVFSEFGGFVCDFLPFPELVTRPLLIYDSGARLSGDNRGVARPAAGGGDRSGMKARQVTGMIAVIAIQNPEGLL
jgi:hypothetical protein